MDLQLVWWTGNYIDGVVHPLENEVWHATSAIHKKNHPHVGYEL